MQFLVLVLLVMLTAFSASSQHVYYVKTDASPSSACPAQPCQTLDQYSSQASTYFTTGATFMFLAGNHTILTPIILKNVSHVAFRGEEVDSVTIFCKSQRAFLCDRVTNLTIEGLTLVLDADDQSPQSALHILNSRGILFTNLTFRGNSAPYNRTVHCDQSEVAIISCLFTGCIAFNGGAVYAHESNITLDGNVFIQNKAVQAGGAIFVSKSFLLLKETLGNTFASNSAAFAGGAIFSFNSSIVIERDTLTSSLDEKKVADSDDPRCYCTNIELEPCGPLPVNQPHKHTTYFSSNSASAGGAVFLMSSPEVLLDGTSIIFQRNSALALNVEHLTFTKYAWILQYGGQLHKPTSNITHYRGAMALLDSVLLLNGIDIVFHDNFAREGAYGGGGGAVSSWRSTVTSNTKHLCFTGNIAGLGGAYLSVRSYISFGADETYTEFDNNSAGDGGALMDKYGTQTLMERVLFQYNHADVNSGGIFAENTTLLFSGSAIDFVGNSGGTVYLRYSHLNSTAAELNFMKNWATVTSGAGLTMEQSVIGRTKQLNFIGNFGISIYIIQSDCRLQSASLINNTALQGTITIYKSNISLHDVNVTDSSGGAVDIYLSNVTFIGNVRINRNMGYFGGGIKAILSSITFKGNTVFEENSVSENGGAIAMRGKATISFSGYVLFNKNRAFLNGGAIYATGKSTSITFADNVHFNANQASYGGAMYFENSASMFLKPNVKLTSSNNYATEHGGAIYNRDAVTPAQCNYLMTTTVDYQITLPTCFIDLFEQTNTHDYSYVITTYNDSAKQGGSFLYGGLLDKCLILLIKQHMYSISVSESAFYPIFMEHILNVSSSDPYSKLITSEAYLLCFCESSQQYHCKVDRSVETYRGRKFTVPFLALAEGNTVTSTPLRAKLSPTARLQPNQRSQYLSSYCINMSYNLYSSEEQEQLTVYPDDGPCLDTGLARAVINVKFLPCPDAFTLSGDQCVCENRLQAVEANCTIFDDDSYITRKAGSKFWVSVLTSNGTYRGLILCHTCPVKYCKTESVNISLAEPDVQCDHNRSGVLCGVCVANYSLMLGSSICQACSNMHLALLFPFAAAGIALVVFLSFLRLTVATGMINSIIIYANIVQANRNLLFPTFTDTNVLTVFIAWMNLDFGFQTCFYHGMDAYAQTWLQFAFPIYVWIIIACMIVTSRYSVTVTKLIGTNPIAVLATLLLMSYAKILKIIIEVYSSVELEYPGNETSRVWLKDANVPYLQSKHLALTVVTTLVVVFFFLPYTLLLLLGYKLYHFTGRRHTRWLIGIKPLLDSYYAPYKMHTRYWTGFLLLVRCALYIVFSYDSLNHTTKSLGAIIMGFTAIIAWLSVKIYTSFYTNVIEALMYLDLFILSTATLAEMHSALLVNSLIGIVFAIMMGIIVYHFHVLYIAKSAFWLKMLAFFTRVTENYPAVTEASPLLRNSPTQPKANYTGVMLREPLLTEN